jgi:hypothetical protein
MWEADDAQSLPISQRFSFDFLFGHEFAYTPSVLFGEGERVTRQIVRTTAGKVLRSDDMTTGERQAAADILRANPQFGNPHVVRCDWCRETRTLFRDENDGPFRLTDRGWRCEPCDVRAASQEVRL